MHKASGNPLKIIFVCTKYPMNIKFSLILVFGRHKGAFLEIDKIPAGMSSQVPWGYLYMEQHYMVPWSHHGLVMRCHNHGVLALCMTGRECPRNGCLPTVALQCRGVYPGLELLTLVGGHTGMSPDTLQLRQVSPEPPQPCGKIADVC